MKTKMLISFIFLLLAGSASATTARSLNIGDLIARSDMIVRGKITDSASFYDRRLGMNYTRLSVSVKKSYLGGKKDGTVTVIMPGGTVNGRVQVVFGVPVLKTGEEVILFLKHVKKRVVIAGLGQGTFVVDPALGRVSRRLNRVRLVGEEFRFPTGITSFEKLLKTSIEQKAKTGK